MFGMNEDKGMNALELLKRDHDDVDEMFKHYEEIKESARKSEKDNLVARICDALTVHASIEETIFYPEARRALSEKGKDLLDEAAVEHQTLKDIIARLEAAPTEDPLYDAGVKVLSEYVKHHVQEEETELFPKVRSSGMDLQAVGKRLAARKEQLMQPGSGPAQASANGGRRSSSKDSIASTPKGR